MSEKNAPPFLVKLDGEEFELKYSFKTIDWFEEKTNRDYFQAITNGLGVRTIAWLLLAGIRHKEKALTYELIAGRLNRTIGPKDQGKLDLGDLTRPIFNALRYYGIAAPTEEDANPLGDQGSGQ